MQWGINCIGDILKAAARSSAGPQSLATFGVDKSENKETPQYVNKTPCQVGRSCKSENSKTPNNLFESYKRKVACKWSGKPSPLQKKWIAWLCNSNIPGPNRILACRTAVAAKSWSMTTASEGEPAWLEEREAVDNIERFPKGQTMTLSNLKTQTVGCRRKSNRQAARNHYQSWSAGWDWQYDQSWSNGDWTGNGYTTNVGRNKPVDNGRLTAVAVTLGRNRGYVWKDHRSSGYF